MGKITLPDVKPFYIATIIESRVFVEGKKHRSMEQNVEPQNRPTQTCPTDFDKVARAIQWRKDSLFNSGAMGQSQAKNELWPKHCMYAKLTQNGHRFKYKT